MTALDRAFIKAYGRPRRGPATVPAARPPASSGVAFERGPSLHRIDQPQGVSESNRPLPTEPAADGANVSAAALPSVEQLQQHAAEIADAVDLAPSAAASAAVKESVAATAADLREAWPARFSTDAPALLDEPPAAAAESTARPLSAFAPIVPAAEPVSPQLEVDRFEWSAECQALSAASPAALDQFVSRLLSGAAEGSQRVALVGLAAAVGRTTVATCLTRRAAAQGANWVLVDADFEKPELAARLGIFGQAGWPRVLAGEQELGELMIASVEDRFAIVPCEASPAEAEPWASSRAAEVFDMLAESYELVLIDAGTPGPGGFERLAALGRSAHLDAAYLVYDARSAGASDVAACARQLTAAGLRVAGAIENFAPRSEDLVSP